MKKTRRHLEGAIGAFVQQYARKSCPHTDPNDRRYNRELESKVKRMRPEDFDELLHGGEDEVIDKDPAIADLVAGLRKSLGAAAFRIVDHWNADRLGIGVAHPRDHDVLAYLATTGSPGRYDIHLELPAPHGSELPCQPAGIHVNVTPAEAADIVRRHLRRLP